MEGASGRNQKNKREERRHQEGKRKGRKGGEERKERTRVPEGKGIGERTKGNQTRRIKDRAQQTLEEKAGLFFDGI